MDPYHMAMDTHHQLVKVREMIDVVSNAESIRFYHNGPGPVGLPFFMDKDGKITELDWLCLEYINKVLMDSWGNLS